MRSPHRAHPQDVSNRRRTRDEGATLVEYGLVVGLLLATTISSMALVGTGIQTLFAAVGVALPP